MAVRSILFCNCFELEFGNGLELRIFAYRRYGISWNKFLFWYLNFYLFWCIICKWVLVCYNEEKNNIGCWIVDLCCLCGCLKEIMIDKICYGFKSFIKIY